MNHSNRALRRVRRRRDDGAFLVIFALCLVVLMLVVAFAVDLGQARSSKRVEQAAADLAALDAGWYLSGRGAGSTPISEPAKACVAAIQSVQRNVSDFAPAFSDAAIEAACAVFPATAATCTEATARQTVSLTAGSHVVSVSYPIPTTDLETTGFSGGVGVDDGTSRCERMSVGLAKTDDVIFGRVAGFDELTTSAEAIVRSSASNLQTQVAALLLLERVGCGVLQTSGGGTTGSGVVVQANAGVPGIIAADSAGQAPPCTTNNNAGGWVVYGTALPAAGGGGPSITAEAAGPSQPGIIAIYATGVGGRGGYIAPTGLNVDPVPGAIASRAVVDERYQAAVTTLHATAATATATVPAITTGLIQGNQECNGTIPAEDLAAAFVFVDCTTFSPVDNVFPNTTDFHVRGNIAIGNNRTLSLPVAQRIYVRGCTVGGCGGATGTTSVRVNNGGALLVNTGQATIPSPVTAGPTCHDRRSPASGGSNTNTTRFVTLSGSFEVAGFTRLCETTLYVGESTAPYTQRSVYATGVAPENYPAITQCSLERPCPRNSSATQSFVSFSGGAAAADWSAPNQLATKPTPADFAVHPFEDLALWTESSSQSNISGQGTNTTRGVFFLPNAGFVFQGQGTQTQPLNAQFIARRLNISGQGSLFMRPNAADAIDTPVVGNITLIR